MLKTCHKRKWMYASLLVSLLLFLFAIPTSADTEVYLAKWLEKVKVKGDFRLRHESTIRTSIDKHDRHRQRLRFRIALDFLLPQQFTIKTRFASGVGEQGSTNQSFDNLSSQKRIWIDRAYLVWTPFDDMVRIQGGRMANPFWQTYPSDIVWDTDVNPEGFSQSLRFKIGDNANLFANFLQMVADEDSGNNSDQWMFGQQIGGKIGLPMESHAGLAVTYYEWLNENFAPAGDLGAVKKLGSNRGGAGVLSNQFGILEITGQVTSKVGHVPVLLEGTFIRNTDHDSSFTPKLDTGYQFGTRIGKAKKAKTWELAYFRKWVQADATLADVADSDFGGTNREGHIFWFAYSPFDWMTLKAKHFVTEVLDDDAAVAGFGPNNFNKTQIDIITKF